MGREDRQNIKNLLPAGSDLPARGKGVTVDNANGAKSETAKGRAAVPPPVKPKGYKGRHEGRG